MARRAVRLGRPLSIAVALMFAVKTPGGGALADDATPAASAVTAGPTTDELTGATLAYRQASQAGRPSEALAPAL